VDNVFRTPLLDCFRRGEAAHDVRLAVARGELPLRALEQLLLLVMLAADSDPEIVAAVEATVARLPEGPLAAFLARSDVPDEVREYFANRSSVAVAPATDDACANELGASPQAEESEPASLPRADDEAAPAEQEQERQSAGQRLAQLNVSSRMKVAMQGTREERGILIRDPNRLVSAAVLASPKLTGSEVEAIARMSNVSDEVLRIIGTTRMWLKNYPVIAALVKNAKTPIAVSLSLLNRLTERDLKMLVTDRNVPEPVRLSARKFAVKDAKRRG
jgi:hypothetical protein